MTLEDRTRIRIGYLIIGTAGCLALAATVQAIRLGEAGRAIDAVVISSAFGIVATLSVRAAPRNGAVWSLIWATTFGAVGIFAGLFGAARAGVTISVIDAGELAGSPADYDVITAMAMNIAAWTWVPAVFLLAVHLLVLFPGGSAPSKRWRITLWVATTFIAAMSISGILLYAPWVKTPYVDLDDGDTGVAALVGILMLPLMAISLTALVSLVRRYRRSFGEERLQYRWVTWAVGVYIMTSFVLFLPLQAIGLVGGVIGTLALASVPFSIGIAITKYRLYDIDIVISRSLVYGALAALIGGLYVVIVVGLGSVISDSSLALSITATALVAVIFEPVRVRLQKWANRLVYGARATPYEVLSDLTGRLASAESGEGLLERMADRIADGTGAKRAVVWLASAEGLRAAASAPRGEAPDETHQLISDLPGAVVAIQHEGDLLGALSVEKPRGDAVTPREFRLIEDLAGSAALVIRRRRLDEALEARAGELQQSRRRVIDAQDVERRKLERDLHDGAQQQVVALKVKLGLARQLAELEQADQATAIIDQMEDSAQQAIEQIRSLAQGIYPPLLEADGLAAAIPALATASPLEVVTDIRLTGRHEPRSEAAVYFCVSEALTNAAKHGTGPVRVEITDSGGDIAFAVTDSGPGFDPTSVERGAGLSNMSDRLDAIGGALGVASQPGGVTMVSGSVPSALKVS